MQDYEIKLLKPEDYHKCGNIWDMKKHPERSENWYKQVIDGSREIYVYIVGGEFIGEVAFFHNNSDPNYSIPNKRVYLSRMVVKSEFRNRGIGGILIDFICDLARERGYSEISLGVDIGNMVARHLYKKKGFTDVVYHGTDQWGEHFKLVKKL